MVRSLLSFNPAFRFKAEELLLSSLFDDIRDPELEEVAASKLQFRFDKAGAYDYTRLIDKKFTFDNYKDMIYGEIESCQASSKLR